LRKVSGSADGPSDRPGGFLSKNVGEKTPVMNSNPQNIPTQRVILLVEDDEEDRALIQEAARQAGVTVPFFCLGNGEQALDFLYHRNDFEARGEEYVPLIIFLDLNLPMESGKTALSAIKGDPELRSLPVIVFTTSASRQEITWAYATGANSIILKPFSYPELITILDIIRQYWFEIVELP
jgi:CheY-like chemotaxis protein